MSLDTKEAVVPPADISSGQDQKEPRQSEKRESNRKCDRKSIICLTVFFLVVGSVVAVLMALGFTGKLNSRGKLFALLPVVDSNYTSCAIATGKAS
jgi:hypothetical protein